MLKEGDIRVIKRDGRHPSGSEVVVLMVNRHSTDKPYYCQSVGGQVCNFYGEEDFKESDE